MIVRWRRVPNLNHVLRFVTVTVTANHSFSFHHERDLNLSPQLVDSTISSCPSDSIALSFFLWCARQRNYFHAKESFDRIVPVVSRLTDRFISVSRVVSELESVGCSVKAQTLLILLRVYWQGEAYDRVIEIFDEMTRRGFVPNTFARNVVLDILFKLNRFDDAVRFWEVMPNPNFITFCIVVGNLCRAGDWWGVKTVLREMAERGYRLNEGTYLMVLNCFCKAGRVKEPMQLLGLMIVLGNPISVAVWTVLVDSLCRSGRVDIANELLEKMVGCGCYPNALTYTSLIKGHLDSHLYSKVSGLLDNMLSSGYCPDLVLWNILMDSLGKAGRYAEAIRGFVSLRQGNLNPDAFTISTLISILSSSGKLSLFFNLVRGLDAIPLDLVCCNSLLSYFCKAGLALQAVRFFRDMLHNGFMPDSYTYAILLDAYCRLGRIENALVVYQDIVANHPKIDPHVHSVILNALIRKRQYHRAVRLLREGRLANCCLDVVCYTNVVKGLLKDGRFEEARTFFEEFKLTGVLS